MNSLKYIIKGEFLSTWGIRTGILSTNGEFYGATNSARYFTKADAEYWIYSNKSTCKADNLYIERVK
jgi:hypothetical protein